jgi:hypothetical protein
LIRKRPAGKRTIPPPAAAVASRVRWIASWSSFPSSATGSVPGHVEDRSLDVGDRSFAVVIAGEGEVGRDRFDLAERTATTGEVGDSGAVPSSSASVLRSTSTFTSTPS